MSSEKWILETSWVLGDDKVPRHPIDMDELSDENFFKRAYVAQVNLNDDVRVSTVLLSIHFMASENPLFETMIFGGKYNHYQDRCYTYAQAKIQHNTAVALAKKELEK